MLQLLRRAYAILKAYVLTDLVRSKGFVFGLLSISMWMLLFITPMALFVDPSIGYSKLAGYAFTAMMIFLFYSTATWDWAAELRWMINDGRLEYYIASGSGFLAHYLGIMPVSLMWISVSLAAGYIVLAVIWAPPELHIHSPVALFTGFTLLILNLIAYALILGGTMISSGVTGFVVEIVGFILPIATGGLTPLANLPKPLQLFALSTPFSYPAELIRYSLLAIPPVLELDKLAVRGAIYTTAFLLIAVAYFRYQLKKILREGVRATSLW